MKKILLTNSSELAIVDDQTYPKASSRRWHLTRWGYVRSTDRPHVFLHHLIVGKPPRGLETDHRNGNKLDNRRQNFRNITRGQNEMNKGKRSDNASGFKGVSRTCEGKGWRAYIQKSGKRKPLGNFTSSIEAAKAYDKAAKKFFGEFARLNFPMRFPRE